jgi:hypothetical protein
MTFPSDILQMPQARDVEHTLIVAAIYASVTYLKKTPKQNGTEEACQNIRLTPLGGLGVFIVMDVVFTL